MKILLIGEFSGFHRALKLGLEKLGNEVTLAGSPDGFKNIPIDINLWPSGKYSKFKILNAFFKQFTIVNGIKNLYNYDIVQFISPMKFNNSIPYYGSYFNTFIYNKLIKNNKKSFLVSCGNDPVYIHIGRKMVVYNPIDAEINYTGQYYKKYHDKKALEWNIELSNKVSGVIPASYDYWLGYSKFCDQITLSSVIPMPILTSEYEYHKNSVSHGKVKFFHGISRPGMKGSGLILKVLEKISNKYSSEIEIDVVERLPIDEYQKKVVDCNILIDQCNSYGYGINALIGMAYGKVVMSGAEPEELNALKVKKSPVINIKPDFNDIYSKIEYIILNKENIEKHGEWARNYVEENHDALIIAQKYIEYWEQ